MSADDVTGFLKTIANDGRVQRDLVEFAAEHGYQFTLDELRQRIPAAGRIPGRAVEESATRPPAVPRSQSSAS